MAYVSQEDKKSKSNDIKMILKKYDLKGTLSIRNHSTLVLTIQSGKIDFIKNYNDLHEGTDVYCRPFVPIKDYIDVNEYHISNSFTGDAKECLLKLADVMNKGNHNNSDSQSDYFDIGFYVNINIGKWDKPYIFIK